VTVTASTHAGLLVICFEHAAPLVASILAPLIRINDHARVISASLVSHYADARSVRYPSKIRLGNRKLTVKMALGDHRDFTRFIIGASLVASLGTNTSPFMSLSMQLRPKFSPENFISLVILR
jgi:hypothetical protein